MQGYEKGKGGDGPQKSYSHDPFCRTVEEARKVIAEMEKNRLRQGKNGLQVYVMCEIPNNVLLIDEFSEFFDGFSIGSMI